MLSYFIGASVLYVICVCLDDLPGPQRKVIPSVARIASLPYYRTASMFELTNHAGQKGQHDGQG